MQTLRHTTCRECCRKLIVKSLAKPRVGARTIRPFTNGTPRRADNNERFKVRWFEQSGDESTRRPLGDLEAAEDGEAKAFKAMLDKEDAELQEMRKVFSKEELRELDHAIAEAKMGENLDEVFNPEEEEEDDDFETAEDDLLNTVGVSNRNRQPSITRHTNLSKGGNGPHKDQSSPLDVRLHLSKDQKPLLNQLNKALGVAKAEKCSASSLEVLWRWYTKCKQILPPFSTLIPGPSWQLLTASAEMEHLTSKKRAYRSRILLEDRKTADQALNGREKCLYIEHLLEEDRPMVAARQWQDDEVALRADGTVALQFEELGVRVFIKAGDVQKAQDLALGRMLSRLGPRSRSLIPLIAACAQAGEDGLKRAWLLYEQFKRYMGSQMTLNDYDEIARIFLDVDRADISLAVFKDHILASDSERHTAQNMSLSFSTLGPILSQATDSHAISQISLTGLVKLPRRFNNKYFYCGWMKRLIAAGDTRGAILVVQLMYRRGIAPDAVHVNGIIGALLRNGSTSDKEKALQLAWTMVRRRLDLVARRKGHSPLPSRLSSFTSGGMDLALPSRASEALLSSEGSSIIPASVNHPLPSATVETFSLLLLYYTRRSMRGYAEKVQSMLYEAEIPPNSFFMNHLLYGQLRLGDYHSVWKCYRDFSRSVRRDLQTFSCLWDTQHSYLGKLGRLKEDLAGKLAGTFAEPRRLFVEMVEFLASQTAHERKDTKERMTQALYAQIVRCFCLAKDLGGTIVCLHALKSSFELYPDEDVARMIAIQIARVGEGTPSRPRRLRIRATAGNPDFSQAAHVLELVANEREEYISTRNIDIEQQDETFRKEESLYILTQFLRTVLEQLLPEDSDMDETLESIARDMGVSGIYTGDHLDKPVVLGSLEAEQAEIWKYSPRKWTAVKYVQEIVGAFRTTES